MPLLAVDWERLFALDTPILEIILRGTITYLFIFVLFRVLMKRESGGLAVTDILVLVLIADAAQNAMAGDYMSITDGMVLVGTIVVWDWFLAWLAFRSGFMARLIRPGKLLLIQNGRLNRRNMRKELITEDELRGKLRLQGYEDFSEVKRAYMESDGHISIVAQERREGGETEEEERVF